MNAGPFQLAATLAFSPLLQGCLAHSLSSAEAVALQDRLHQDAVSEFMTAAYYKPRPNQAGGMIDQLAPLVVHQDEPHRAPDTRGTSGFGTPYPCDSGGLRIDTARPVMYARETGCEIDGAVGNIVDFVWFMNDLNGHASPRVLRILSDPAGTPVVWEVIDGRRNGLKRVFVDRGMELRANKAFGGASDDRRYAIERSVSDSGAVFVARLLETGPVPMGPYVYIDATENRILSVVCRCMDSQVDEFVSEQWYELLPFDEVAGLAEVRHRLGESILEDLDEHLRWPGLNSTSEK